ncbi:MAG TPA: hypothetical protein VLW85_22210 [Myxococcales bacterium]|nr:hypothetical protein [Myxococcales bacterium]
MNLRARAACCAAAALLAAAPAAPAERLVVLYDNRSGDPRAVGIVATSFDGVLRRKGHEVIDSQEVTDFLEAKKVTRLDPLPDEVADRVTLRFHADAVVAVTIDFMLDTRPRRQGPKAGRAVGVSARLVSSDGRELWRNSMGLLSDELPVGDDRPGAMDDAVGSGCERLLFSFPRADRAQVAAADDSPRRSRFSLQGARTNKKQAPKKKGRRTSFKAAGTPSSP